MITLTTDYSEYYAAIKRLYDMGEVRKRDITNVFRTASRPQVATAKRLAGRSKRGGYSKQYPSRDHPPGFLRANVKFKVSKKFRHIYYVNSGAWYSMIYIGGHGSFKGNTFMTSAINATDNAVGDRIIAGMSKLIGRVWDGR